MGQTGQLESQTGFVGGGRIHLAALSAADQLALTPKLRRIIRWIGRTLAEEPTAHWDSLVWIDDQHGADAHTWARTASLPVLLVTPVPREGLTPEDVCAIRKWIAQP